MTPKKSRLKTQTLICSVNNNSLAIQPFTVVFDTNYKWVSHVSVVTATGDTSYQISIGDDNGLYITNVHSRILEAGTDVPTMDKFYLLNAINGKQTFTINITRLVAVAVTGSVHVIFRLEQECPQ